MAKLTKEELAAKLTETTGLEISWEKLSAKDLQVLLEAFNQLGNLAEIGMKNVISKVQGVASKEIEKLGDMTIKEILSGNGPLIKAMQKKGGILGFGILSKIQQQAQAQT